MYPKAFHELDFVIFSMLELFAKHNSLILGLGEVMCFKPKTFAKPSKFLDLYLEYALVVAI
jgi:hypothetical protein